MDPAKSDGAVFICGEDTLAEDDYILPMKSVLTAKLATNWAVRTHYDPNGSDPRGNKDTLFRNISASYVFLFIFNEETTVDAFYLNQLGIAFARGVPIVGIREPSYIMPNPLPEHYYTTEIVDLTSGDRNRPHSRSKAILSNLLIESFRNAVVYTNDFHKSCIERLFRKVSDAYTKTEKERTLPPNVTVTDCARGEPSLRQKLWTSVSGFTKCPKCGTTVKTSRKSSALRKTNSVDHLFKKEGSTHGSKHQTRVTTPQLLITKSVLQPLTGQHHFSRNIFNSDSRRPATSVIRKSASARAGGREIEHIEAVQSRPTSTKSCNAVSTSRSGKNLHKKHSEIEYLESKLNSLVDAENIVESKEVAPENPKQNSGKVARKKSMSGFVTNRRGAFLRKMSSLPCIPTTYLVAEPGSQAPAFVRYPPANGTLTVGDPNVPEFTDDEDKETIHISRRPSPAISTCSTNIE
ncbi:uncharacterized protein LOC114527704 [Dendronephthya gigantea]|uniref:uncharacterized protein LOC114527704 n=1 Tax=Dendronephthya gigantea TaxID=151771 RepID=UPI00106C9232|nr:uncharacterized protein LOC114527704 [Dendronephthya gigantea]